jgi:hypothetical protein
VLETASAPLLSWLHAAGADTGGVVRATPRAASAVSAHMHNPTRHACACTFSLFSRARAPLPPPSHAPAHFQPGRPGRRLRLGAGVRSRRRSR